jgi:hypothetical protein
MIDIYIERGEKRERLSERGGSYIEGKIARVRDRSILQLLTHFVLRCPTSLPPSLPPFLLVQ